jgi:hypothetical protein
VPSRSFDVFWGFEPAVAKALARQPSLLVSLEAKAGGGGGSRTYARAYNHAALEPVTECLPNIDYSTTWLLTIFSLCFPLRKIAFEDF